MASSFTDIDFLMDHNIAISSSATSQVSGTIESRLPPGLPTDHSEEQQQILNVQHCYPLPPLASLSLAFHPTFASVQFHSGVRKTSDFPSVPVLPSQKKCISSMPIMTAVVAANSTVSPHPSSSEKVKKVRTAFPDYQRLPDRHGKSPYPSNGAAMRRASIVWFRNDLRTHDHEALFSASKESLSVVPVYVFDPRDYGKSSSGFDKTGPYRAKFLLQSVMDLKEKLKQLGSNLVVRVGKPEDVLVNLAKSVGADALYAHQEVSYDEVQAENKVSAALQEEGVDVKYFWGSTLFHIDDLPFKLEDMPTTYAGFRQKVQNIATRSALERPKQLRGFPIRGGVKAGDIPTLEELGVKTLSSFQEQSPSSAALVGGEVEALKKLNKFATEISSQSSKVVNEAKGIETNSCSNSLYGSNFSCKISPWLAVGCLSPRYMLEEFKHGQNSGPMISGSASSSKEQRLSWLVFELLWRDFFRFVTRKYASSRADVEANAQSGVAVAV